MRLFAGLGQRCARIGDAADAGGNAAKLIEEDDSVNGMWYYEGRLYYLLQNDYGINAIKALNVATRETRAFEETVRGTYPSFAVVAGYIYYTTAGPDFNEFDPEYLLVRTPADGGGAPAAVAEKVLCFQVYDGTLYYLAREENGASALYGLNPASAEQSLVRSGVSLPFCIDGGDIYYTMPSGEGGQLVKAAMKGDGQAALFDGHFASNDLIVFGDSIYFDEWDGMQMRYYIGAKDGGRLEERDDAFPYAAPDLPVEAPQGTSYLYLEAGDELASCFKLYDADGNLIWTELLEAGAGKTVSFDSGKYYLKIGEGKKWISDEEAFGPDGKYSSTALFDFLPGKSYRIGSGTRGDFHTDSQSGFVGK